MEADCGETDERGLRQWKGMVDCRLRRILFMADGGDHGVASMEGSGRGRKSYTLIWISGAGAWRILGSGTASLSTSGFQGRTVHQPCVDSQWA
jgi:hypothetical protein